MLIQSSDVVIGTSSYLMEHSHGKDMTYITNTAIEVINFVKSHNIEIRFSSEDSFRSNLVDLLNIYHTVDKIGVNRVGIADTVGCANPRQVYDLIRTLRGVVSCDIETHFHNDTGCAIANAYCALEAGATHIDTSVLGIGERNGITPLGGLMARMIVADRDYVMSKYKLHKLKDIEDLVAQAVEVNIPFNNYSTCTIIGEREFSMLICYSYWILCIRKLAWLPYSIFCIMFKGVLSDTLRKPVGITSSTLTILIRHTRQESTPKLS